MFPASLLVAKRLFLLILLYPLMANTPTAIRRSIALITASTRRPRVGPSVAAFVQKQLVPLVPSNLTLNHIDLNTWQLPFSNEPVIPSHLSAEDPTAGYTYALSRAWSQEVRKHSAFVIVAPTYNAGIAAPLKNAIDYLYHEWAGKPVMVVTYGGGGGGATATALAPVLKGLKMKMVSTSPALILGKSMLPAMKEGVLVEGQDKTWLKDGVGEKLGTAWAELVEALEESETK